ncbi:MAG: hypothetical protein HOW73_07170 [Polyangiaceae bacterium]|nr:hypothetical protein [Polyangiaceae bacterium]
MAQATVWACFLAIGCSGSDSAKPASAEKKLEIVHEPCDVDSGSAIRTDVNGDGSPDIIKVMSGNKEVCRAVDLNFDKVKDAFIYFDGAGNERRRESDFDKDGRPDEIAVREGGVIVSKELETNYDKKLDTWETYVNGRLAKAERDSDADGIIDEWWDYNQPDKPECAVVVSDKNQDGEPDPDTAVDMCGEGYKPPPINYTSGSPTATATASAPGAFTGPAPTPGTAATSAKPATSGPAPATSASVGAAVAASASAAAKTSASAPTPPSSASAAPKGKP